MAASQEQKLDYLLKKIGYSATKTGIAEDESLSGSKKAPFAEAIPSPLVVPSTSVWRDSVFIPSTPPGATTNYVRVYDFGTAVQMTVDSTVSGNRSFIAYTTYNNSSTPILGDWIDPSFGADYIIKVYAGDPNSGGTQLSASGSGSNDTWFFDYSSGVLNFNGTAVPSGVTSSNIYLVGYRYLGTKGVGAPGGLATFTSLQVSGVSTFQSDINLGNGDKIVFGTTDDLQIYHDGNDAYVADTGAGDLKLRGTAAIRLENSAGTETYAQFNVDGASELYYDNAKKLETTPTGVVVTGMTTTSSLVVTGDVDVDGHTNLDNVSVAGVSTFASNLNIGGDLQVTGNSLFVGVVTFSAGTDGTIQLGSANTDNVVFTADVNSNIVPNTNNAYDLGSSSQKWRSLFVGSDASIGGAVTATSFDGNLNALGNTYYVSENGDNSNSGNNINEPFLTITRALQDASSGDVVNVSAGTFVEMCPLTVPAGVTIKGAGLRATSIKPTDGTKTNNVFLLNDASTLEDFTIKDSFYNTSADTGYAFSFASNASITTRSPYIQRITVLNKGSQTSASDPYGFNTADNPPTTYVSGRGAYIDGQNVTSNSLEAGMLFNEVTFFTPNQKGIVLTNGARAEYLNCFHYFASRAVEAVSGSVGLAGTARVRLKFDTPSVTLNVNDVVKLRDGGGTVVGLGTVVSYDAPYAEISGKGHGLFTVGAGTTQDVKFYQSNGATQTGIASAITLADYTKFGAEMRSVGCAFEYGTQGVVADGIGVKLRLFATNFNHVGSGNDFSNDSTLTVQANEVVELNNGKVSFVSIDQSGDFRVGDAFVVQQETGNVSFASTTYNLETTGNLTVTDGGSNQSQLSPTSLTVGDLQLASSTVSSDSGDITIDPAGGNKTIIQGDLSATGIVTAAQLYAGPNGIGIGVSTITGPAEILIDPAAVGDDTGTVIIKGDLQVDGTQTIVNSTTMSVDDKNLLLGSGAANDAAADGGGITLESGDGNKTINWVDSTDSWTFSENVDLASTKTYKINNVDVLSSTTLGAGVTQSSLTSVGTLESLTVSGVINSTTDVRINGTGVLQSASDEAIALAIALG